MNLSANYLFSISHYQLALRAGVENLFDKYYATYAGAPVAILGIILPIYTIIDMVETAENVWSDSCVSAMVDKDLK